MKFVSSLPLKTLRHYASARIGSTLLINMVDVSLFFLYRNIYGLDDIPTGTAIAIAKIAVGLFSLLLGVLNDNTPIFIQKRIGSNKFWLVIGSPALSLTYVLLFLPPDGLDQLSLYRWLLIFNVLFHLFYAFVSISYLAWLPKITLAEERTKVSKYQNIFNSIGALVATLSFVIVTGIHGDNPEFADLLLNIVVFSYATVQIFAFYSIIRSVPSTLVEEEPTPSLKSQFSIFMGNRNFVIWVVVYGIFSIGLFMLTTLLLDIITIVLRLDTTIDLAIFGISFTLFTVLGFFIWERYEERLGEKTTPLRHSMILSVLVLISLAVVTIEESKLVITLLFGFLLGVGISSYFLLPVAIIADMVEHAEAGWYQSNLTQVTIAGTFTGFARISLNFIQSIGGYIAGVVAAFELYRFSGMVASIFLIVAFFMLRFVKIDVLKS